MKEIEQLRQRSRELQSRLSSINVDLVSLGALPVLDIDEETESSEEQEKTDSMTVLKKLKATVEGKDNQKQDEKSDEVDVDIANTVKETRLAARQFKFHQVNRTFGFCAYDAYCAWSYVPLLGLFFLRLSMQSVMAHRLTSGVTFFELPKRLPSKSCGKLKMLSLHFPSIHSCHTHDSKRLLCRDSMGHVVRRSVS